MSHRHNHHRRHKKCDKKDSGNKSISTCKLKARCIKAYHAKIKDLTAENALINGDLEVGGKITFEGCKTPVGVVKTGLSLESPTTEVSCDVNVETVIIRVDSALKATVPPVPDAIAGIPDQTIPQGDSLLLGDSELRVTNIAGDGVLTGPWYVGDQSGQQVINCGLPELYSPFSLDDMQPPKNSTLSELLVENVAVTPNTIKVIDLSVRYSTELGYDFVTVRLNEDLLLSVSDTGPVDSPFLQAELSNVALVAGDKLSVRYVKDGNVYQGLDMMYFTILNVRTSIAPAFPSSINILRGPDVFFSFNDCTLFQPLDSVTAEGSQFELSPALHLLTGDVLQLVADNAAWDRYDVSLCFSDVPIIRSHIEPEEHTAKLTMNSVVINYEMPASRSTIGGWYENDNNEVVWIEDQGTQLVLTSRPGYYSGPFYITNNQVTVHNFSCLGEKRYQAPSFFRNAIYVFDSETGRFVIDYSDPETLYTAAAVLELPNFYTPILNPNERLWSYEQRLTDPTARFNNPVNFFDFVYNFLKMGYLTSYTQASSQLPGSANPNNLDLTQVKRTIGGKTIDEYDDLYKELQLNGILREYRVKKAVYWPYPGTVADEALKAQTRYYINQNRYNYLAFIIDDPSLSTESWPRLCPGERVQLSGTGVPRLEEEPLRLATSGYDGGPLAPNTHGPQYMIDNWAYYTFRLPMVITEQNNVIQTSSVNFGNVQLELPLGTFYFGELTDFISAAFVDFSLNVDVQLGRYNVSGDLLAEIFGPEYVTALANLQAASFLVLKGVGAGDVTIYGPDHPTYPSSFFGPLGMDIGSKFGGSQEIVVIDDGSFDVVPALTVPIQEYKPHTPLTEEELSTLVANLPNITLSKRHGPIRNGMAADDLVACVLELSLAHSTETHQVIAAWSKKCEGGLDELFLDFSELVERLNRLDLPNTFSVYPYEFDVDILPPIPYIRVVPIRFAGQGDFSEMTLKYRACGQAFGRTIQSQTRGNNYLTWNPVRRDNFYYPPGTVLPGFGDLSGRENETVVSYLQEAFWMVTTADPMTNAPVFSMAAYDTNTSFWATMEDGSPPPKNPNVVAGNWMVGLMKPEVVARALSEAGVNPLPDPLPVYGYLTHDVTYFSAAGDVTQLPWYDPGFELISGYGSVAGAVGMMSKIFQYFNANNVSHWIFDKRTTIGGGSPLQFAIPILCGGDRTFNFSVPRQYMHVEPNGAEQVWDFTQVQQKAVDEGVLTFPVLNVSSLDDCKPSAYLAAGVPADGFFKGTPENPKNIIWLHPCLTISGTQLDFATFKGTSLDQSTYDGDLGENTRIVMYGSYTLPFSTAGNYASIVDYYGKARAGSEPIEQPPMYSIDRWEGIAFGYHTTNDNAMVRLDEEFNQLIRPHILWDFQADTWFQDFGFVTGSPSVVPTIDGEPWVAQRSNVSNFVDYNDISTWRDAIMDRAFFMAQDPALPSHIYTQDTYGFVAEPPSV